MDKTAAHEQRETFTIDVEYPEHIQRKASSEFEANRRQLIGKLKTPCLSCGATEHLEAHHFLVEWSEAENTDWAKVTQLSHHFDIYGFAGQLGDKPITSPDDIRNLVILCVECHRGRGTGIHLVPFPNWISQVVARNGVVELKSIGSKPTGGSDGDDNA